MSIYAVAISGGVDSAVTATTLLKEGHEVFGITMVIDDRNKDCLVQGAKVVTDYLKIPHYIYDLCSEFKREVIDYFITSYQMGLTPNPCAVCNKKIKLHKLLKFAQDKGADYLATGHYARLQHIDNRVELYESENTTKDQSYFLSLTSIDDLKYVRFPLQNIKNKSITRKLAKSYGLPNFAKVDSQDICFVPNNDYVSVIHKYSDAPDVMGDFILNGKAVGKHRGLIHYTIGQRRGLNISYSYPLYVISTDFKKNTITLGKRTDLLKDNFLIRDVNTFCDIGNVSSNSQFFVKIRSGNKKFLAEVKLVKNNIAVHLLEPNTTAVCPGQIGCIYDKAGRVIAGGIISC